MLVFAAVLVLVEISPETAVILGMAAPFALPLALLLLGIAGVRYAIRQRRCAGGRSDRPSSSAASPTETFPATTRVNTTARGCSIDSAPPCAGLRTESQSSLGGRNLRPSRS